MHATHHSPAPASSSTALPLSLVVRVAPLGLQLAHAPSRTPLDLTAREPSGAALPDSLLSRVCPLLANGLQLAWQRPSCATTEGSASRTRKKKEKKEREKEKGKDRSEMEIEGAEEQSRSDEGEGVDAVPLPPLGVLTEAKAKGILAAFDEGREARFQDEMDKERETRRRGKTESKAGAGELGRAAEGEKGDDAMDGGKERLPFVVDTSVDLSHSLKLPPRPNFSYFMLHNTKHLVVYNELVTRYETDGTYNDLIAELRHRLPRIPLLGSDFDLPAIYYIRDKLEAEPELRDAIILCHQCMPSHGYAPDDTLDGVPLDNGFTARMHRALGSLMEERTKALILGFVSPVLESVESFKLTTRYS